MTDWINCIPEIKHTGPDRNWSVQVMPLVAPGVLAITDSWSGTAREVYRKGRRIARIALRHRPAALKGGRRVHVIFSIDRNGRFYAVDGVRVP